MKIVSLLRREAIKWPAVFLSGLLVAIMPAAPVSSATSYYLPYAYGTTATVTQGPGGGASHNPGSDYEHAYDFDLNGGEVWASAPGKIKAKVNNVTGQTSTLSWGNYVLVEHTPGRCTRYAHMAYDTITGLAVGADVAQGEYLGREGNTGFTLPSGGGHHLHFQLENCGSASVSVDFVESNYTSQDQRSASSQWGVNSLGRVYQWNGSSWDLKPGTLTQVEAGDGGVVWGVNSAEHVFRWSGSSWVMKPGVLTSVSVGTKSDGSENVWGLNSAGRVYQWNGTTWDLKPGTLSQIDVGDNGAVWGVNSAGTVFKWNGSSWVWHPGALSSISAGKKADGSENVWGLNSAGRVYQWNSSSWDLKPGTLAQIDAGNGGVAWGVNAAGNVFSWNGSSWVGVAGALSNISVGTE